MLGFLVLVAALASGPAILRIAGVRSRVEERLVVGAVLGLAAGFWSIYLLSSATGELSTGVLVAFVALAAVLVGVAQIRPAGVPWRMPARWFVVLAGVLAVVVTILHVYGVLARDAAGNLVASEHMWADTPFHASQVTAFAYRDNIPPTYTIALDQPLNYPFLVNFASGVLLFTGWGLKSSLIVVAIAVQVLFFLSVALIAHRLTGSRAASVLAVSLFFALGNLGFLAAGQDIEAAGGFWSWLRELPWSYTGDALGDPGRERLGTGLYLGNPVYIYLLPERSSAFGMATAGVLLLLLDDLARGARHAGGRLAAAVPTGILLGILPRIHAHLVLVVASVALTWFLLLPMVAARADERVRDRWKWLHRWREALPAWAAAGAIALVIGLPQVLLMRRQSAGFFSWWPAWAGEPHEAWVRVAAVGGTDRLRAIWSASWETARFWLLNAGVLIVLAVPAYLRAPRRMRLFYLPFAGIWLFGNLVKTQPWEWDNNNLFIYWQLATVILVAPWLLSLLRSSSDPVFRWGTRVAAVSLVVLLTLGGALSFTYWAQTRYHLWTPQEVELVEWIREHTPPDAVVLTSNSHSHPVLALSGRQGFMGFTGWISAHNLDWRMYEERLRRMYGGDVELMRRLGIDYVVVGPWERGAFGEDVLARADDLDPVHASEVDGRRWTILEVEPA